MKQVYIVDCETQPFDGIRETYAPFCWGVLWRTEAEEFFRIFESTKDFISFVIDHEGIYYAHNGGKFDWFFVTEYINAGSDVLFINGRLAKFTIAASEFRDSYSILPVPLSAYKKDDFDYNLLNDYEKNRDVIHKYLRNDCFYLADLVYAFRALYGDALTTPSAALKFWAKEQGYKKAEYTTDNAAYDAFYRAFYYGGRCESAIKGEVTTAFKCWDINSAYPFAMTHLHPWGYHDTEGTEKDIEGKSFVTVKAQQTGGAFPFRKQDGGIAFPNDSEVREYAVTGWEFLAAKRLGLLKNYKVLQVRTHNDEVNFRDYVSHFFAIKRTASRDKPEYLLSKLFLNSLYGKFGTDPNSFKQSILADPKSGVSFTREGTEFNFVSQFSKTMALYEGKNAEPRFFNVAIAASITGFVRAYLLEAISAAKGFLYCDTDSIFAHSFAGKVGDDLGEWKLEGGFSRGWFCGKKMYYAVSDTGKAKKDKFAHKGVKLRKADYAKLVSGKEIRYRFEAPSISLKKKTVSYVERKIKMT